MKKYKNIERPKHMVYTHCFLFTVDDGKSGETFVYRDLETDFEGVDYDKYIDRKVQELYSKYNTNVKIEGSRLGLWEYDELIKLGVAKLC